MTTLGSEIISLLMQGRRARNPVRAMLAGYHGVLLNECDLLTTARARATEIVRGCTTAHGSRASAGVPGYPQVCARDSNITGLGALASRDADLIATLRASLLTPARHRSDLGHIPLNVDPATGEISGENAAGVDSNLWFVIAHAAYFRVTADRVFIEAAWPDIEAAVSGRLDDARAQVHALALANQQGVHGEWELNEWLHGHTGLPMGYPHQAWSAGMYLFADAAVQYGAVPLLNW